MGLVRISYPHEGHLPAERLFPSHHLARDPDLQYLGTHYMMDVYVSLSAGYMYCVFGGKDSEYYSSVGYGLTRTHRADTSVPTYHLAAACALLRHPQYTDMVFRSHP